VLIKDCGVYKFSQKKRSMTPKDQVDFKPEDFLKARASR
jgi:hypothetical protein